VASDGSDFVFRTASIRKPAGGSLAQTMGQTMVRQLGYTALMAKPISKA
jgi:hypothetical protein